jgi:hypothetical protein
MPEELAAPRIRAIPFQICELREVRKNASRLPSYVVQFATIKLRIDKTRDCTPLNAFHGTKPLLIRIVFDVLPEPEISGIIS